MIGMQWNKIKKVTENTKLINKLKKLYKRKQIMKKPNIGNKMENC